MNDTKTTDLDELYGKPVVDDTALDEIEAEAPVRGSSIDFTKLEVGESPFNVKEVPLRPRTGWHQTWVCNDRRMSQYLQWGYKFIREQLTGKDADGKKIPRQAVGQEKGEKVKRFDRPDAQNRPVYEYAMEIPQELVDADIRASEFRSHRALKDVGTEAKAWAEGKNSSLGRKDAVVRISDETYEEGREVVHPVSNE